MSGVFVTKKDRLSAGPLLLGYLLLVTHRASVCATARGSRGGGGSPDPSAPRSPGVSPQKGRAAHGPLHPAVTTSLEILMVFCCASVLVLVLFVWLVLVPFASWVGIMFGSLALQGRPLLDLCLLVLPFVQWVCLSATFVSFFSAVRFWGNANPLAACRFP